MSRAQRIDSWDSDDHTIRTEAELHSQFEGPGFRSKEVTLGEVVKSDIANVTAYARGKYKALATSAGEIHSVGDAAVLATSVFPVVKTVRNYKLKWLYSDAAAGLVEGFLKVPSGLAYAPLAHMPPVYGLYTSLMPPFLYMMLGTCNQISFGVTAIEALFLGESISGILGEELASSEEPADVSIRVQYTLFLSFLVGLWQLVFRFANLGFISSLLADPVMSGFSTGGAFIIGTSQLAGLLGIKLPNTEFLPDTWKGAINAHSEWNGCAIGMGLSGLGLLYILQFVNKRYFKRFPFPWQALLVLLSIIVTKVMKLAEKYDLSVVGEVPSGFPPVAFPHMPAVPGKSAGELLALSIAPSLLIALFVYVMSLSLGTFFAGKNGYKVNANQELTAIGLANTISSMFGAFICSASFSRTAVCHQLGAKTVLHNVVALILMFLAITTITDQLYYLPKPILAAVVINALGPMLEFGNGINYYKLNKVEFFIWFTTFVVCLFGGAMYGIYTGVGLALLHVLVRSATSKTVVLGRLPGTTVYRNIERFEKAQEVPGVRIIRQDGSLNFANYEAFVATLERLATKDIHSIVVDASSINSIDSSSMKGLLHMINDFETKNVKLVLANWKGPQRDMLERSGFYEHVTNDTIFLTLHDAVVYAKGRAVSADMGSLLPPPTPSPSAAVAQEPATVTETGAIGMHRWRIGYSDAAAETAPGHGSTDGSNNA